jgi:lipopolysaccharide/colanic/teichoic acid biosynthesis glycosyltransferase
MRGKGGAAMKTKSWSFANPLRHIRRSRTLRRIHPPVFLRDVIERERGRADRLGQFFSLILFDIDSGNRMCGSNIQRLVLALARRIRVTDEMGWLDDRCLAAVLPGTPSEGAGKMAADVDAKVVSEVPGGPFYRYTVYTYPATGAASGESPGSGGPLGEDPHRTGGLGEGPLKKAPTAGAGSKDAPTVRVDGRANAIIERMILGRSIPLWKRALDVAGALAALILLLPVFAAVALLIKVVSPGPVFFRQERIGYRRNPFTFWKFRTMQVGNDPTQHRKHLRELIKGDQAMVKLDDERDPRIIPFGRFLRRSCLDELPQLFNVLGGTMSLVGPRPCLPYEAREYLLWHARRFDILPGMTGLWQVSGKNRTTFKEMIRLDIRYARKVSPWMDIGILLRTVPAIVSQAVGAAVKARSADLRKAA